MSEPTEPTDSTLAADRDDAEAPHMADRAATPDEEAAAERGREEVDADPENVAAHYEEMADLGAHVKGEGEID
jgi:hypothetical protein